MNQSKKDLAKQYEKILGSISDGVYSVNLKWQVTYFNRAAEKITGIPREEAVGRSCIEVFRSNVCETKCLLRETFSNNKPILNRPIYIVRGDKKTIPISFIFMAAIPNPQPTPSSQDHIGSRYLL